MKNFKIIAVPILIVAFGLLISLPGFSADTTGKKSDTGAGKKGEETQNASTLTYKPPLRGTPGGRIGGGTRGETGKYPDVLALVPDHTGLTTQEQPCLYWFLSKSANCPIVFSIIEDNAERPLVETPVKDVTQPGVESIRLADYGVRLKKEVGYQWYVALVPDPDARSRDIVAGGRIERVDPQKDLNAMLGKAGKTNAAQVYARAGLWYDALEAVSDLIAAAPSDKRLRGERISLLQQVGLTEVADFERMK